MRIPLKFSIKDSLSFFYVNPWLGLLIALLITPFKTKLDTNIILVAFFAFAFSFLAVFHNNNFDSFINWLILITLLIFSLNYKNNSNIPSMLIADLYFFIGALVMLYIVFISSDTGTNRWGLWGGEPNFSGLAYLSYLVVYLSRGFSRAFGIYLFVLFLSILICTVSRTLLVSSVLLTFFYYFRNRRFLITLAFLVVANSVFFGSYIISFIDDIAIFEKTGYSEGIGRLISINDYSSAYRLELQQIWYEEIFSSYQNFLFGMPASDFLFLVEVNEANVHNSFIQKTAEYGIVYTLLFIILSLRYLPLWIVYSFFTYSLFLHNVLSIPWVIIISLLIMMPNQK